MNEQAGEIDVELLVGGGSPNKGVREYTYVI